MSGKVDVLVIGGGPAGIISAPTMYPVVLAAQDASRKV